MSRLIELSQNNEELAKAFSKALSRAPLAIPLALGGAAIDATINTSIVAAQVEKPLTNNCIITIQTENKENGAKTSAHYASDCKNITRVEVDFPRSSHISSVQGTSDQLHPKKDYQMGLKEGLKQGVSGFATGLFYVVTGGLGLFLIGDIIRMSLRNRSG